MVAKQYQESWEHPVLRVLVVQVVLREVQVSELRILFGKFVLQYPSQNFNKINLGSSILFLYLYSKLKHYEQRKGIECSKRSNG